jgi:hypothetical protein
MLIVLGQFCAYDPLPPFGGGPPQRGTVSHFRRFYCPPLRGTAAERRQGVISQKPCGINPAGVQILEDNNNPGWLAPLAHPGLFSLHASGVPTVSPKERKNAFDV